MKSTLKQLIRSFGYEISKAGVHPDEGEIPVDMRGESFESIYHKVKEASFTSVEPLYQLHESVKYICAAGIPGALVECGVWKGGSAMMMAHTLGQLGQTDREIWLYDTFEGMSEPGESDIDFRGQTAKQLLNDQPKGERHKNIWCYSSLEEVQKNMTSTKYPGKNIRYVKGKVENTIPAQSPGNIALLRLDTDWYSSTLHELEHLYPKLSKGGVLIIDDYGHWQGARKAVDEYFQKNNIVLALQRIDYSVRVAIKP